MKILIYQLSREAPFEVFYWKIGTNLVFSNRSKYISNFDGQRNTLGTLLPENSDALLTTTDSLLFVPVAMESRFCQWIKQKYSELAWSAEDQPHKPSKADIGLLSSDEEEEEEKDGYSQFYDQMKVQKVLIPKRRDSTQTDISEDDCLTAPVTLRCDLQEWPTLVYTWLKGLLSTTLEQPLRMGMSVVVILLVLVALVVVIQPRLAEVKAKDAVGKWENASSKEGYEDAKKRAQDALRNDKNNSKARAILVAITEYKIAEVLALVKLPNCDKAEVKRLVEGVREINPNSAEADRIDRMTTCEPNPPPPIPPPVPAVVCFSVSNETQFGQVARRCCARPGDSQATITSKVIAIAGANGINLNTPYQLHLGQQVKIPQNLVINQASVSQCVMPPPVHQ